MIDYADAYRDLRERVTKLLSTRSDADLEQVAPATPEWRVRDIVAHMGGVCDDIAQGNMAAVASDEWTAAQVAKRREWPFDRVLADWDENASTFEPIMNDLGPAVGQMLADAATHEFDVRGALGEPGGRDSKALVVGLGWAIDEGLSPRFTRDGLGTLRLEHEVGTDTAGSDDPITTVRASRFELVRAMAGRRSRAQMAAFDWDGPLDPAELLLADFFTPPAADLVE